MQHTHTHCTQTSEIKIMLRRRTLCLATAAVQCLALAPAVLGFLPPAPVSSGSPSSWRLHAATAAGPAKMLQIDPRLQPVIYQGPTVPTGEVDREVGAVLEEYSLALEVGPSQVVQGERGLFIRLIGDDVEEATVEWGSILCGYGEGEMRPHPGTSDKAVLFSLPSSDSAVFFNKELLPLWEVLAELPDGTGLLGHEVKVDHKGLILVEPQPEFEGNKYFVPKEGIPDKAAFIGLFANDLAIGGPKPPSSPEEYEEASDKGNIAGLVWRVDFDKEKGMVVPTRPVVTFGRSVTFKNKEPMEVGLRYGWRFWSNMEEK